MSLNTLTLWHEIVKNRDAAGLSAVLADDAVLESPVLHTPQAGKPITTMYLTAALSVLVNDSFHYVNEWRSERSAVLEFETTVEGITINGVDMIFWNEAGQINRFKVMVRPLKGLNKLHELMGRMLQQMSGKSA